MLEERITELKQKIVEYTGIVEGMVDKSMKGLFQKKKELLDEVIEKDEPKANEFEIRLDELCTTIIAQFQPKARDLRTILMILKMNNDLERLADHAVNISQSALFLIERPPVKPYIDLPKMSEIVIGMLTDSVNGFINEDATLAKEICQRDDEVDRLKVEITKELAGFMAKDPNTIDRALNLLRITTNLERIADLSTNICEDVVFLVEGRVIKHHQDE